MKRLRLHFCDFSAEFVPQRDFFYKILSDHYEVILDSNQPDFLIYSCYGHDFLRFDCTRIFYTAENIRPDFNLCDYAIGFDYIDFGDRYLRLPNYARYGDQFEALVQRPHFSESDLSKKPAFCNFIYSNAFADPTRDAFFHLLSKYKRVDSLGRHLTNTQSCGSNGSDWRLSKVDLQRPYKFSIAFENSSTPGYTTEKILHAFIAHTIPIYWGNPLIEQEFNPKAFINCYQFGTLDEAVQRVVELDSDDNQYLAMLNEPSFRNNAIPTSLAKETVLRFFTSIFDQGKTESFRRPRYGTTRSYEQAFRDATLLAQKANKARRTIKAPLTMLKRLVKQ